MRITIAAVGKLQATAPESLLIHQYSKRIPWNVNFVQVNAKKSGAVSKITEEEGGLLLQAMPQKSKCIVLDERGKNLTSAEFSKYISRWQDDGARDIAFLIGGAAGHSEAVRSKADMLLSLGKLTWPHMMVRAMLVEQIYRAYTIQSGHPYHKV